MDKPFPCDPKCGKGYMSLNKLVEHQRFKCDLRADVQPQPVLAREARSGRGGPVLPQGHEGPPAPQEGPLAPQEGPPAPQESPQAPQEGFLISPGLHARAEAPIEVTSATQVSWSQLFF